MTKEIVGKLAVAALLLGLTGCVYVHVMNLTDNEQRVEVFAVGFNLPR